jgi:signal transduction histidine kinase
MRLSDDVEGAGYFAVAEALANSLKHADAEQVEVELSVHGAELGIHVRDDGNGFDPDRAAGNGLANLSARVSAVGGTLRVRSAPGTGTAVVAVFAIGGQGISS